ncbi:MAG: quinol dehydrogenase ferredoxin subunit NapH [Dechloromonas sp.]|nr:quinol dehydrogenase ferredoxin subunit NapH [Dechloromonas sp.]
MTIGQDAIRTKGWLGAHRFLVLRRLSQSTVLLAFLIGPWFGLWWVKGNLASSLTFGVLPLTDPYLFVQTLAAGFMPASAALIGAAVVLGFYALLGGRLYCAWVCPVNPLTDLAAWLRRRWGLKSGRVPDSATRYWVLAGSLLTAAATGTLVWEWVNPVSILQRSLIFGLSGSVLVVGAVFFYDLLVASRGWCGHLCPMGAFYGLLGQKSLLRVTARQRSACDDCMDCFAICPEPQVIRPALKKVGQESPLILDRDCTNCGRCIDICGRDVFHFTHRFDQRSDL